MGEELIETINLSVFNSKNFGNIRVIDRDGEPWFVANDVCKILTIKNPWDALSRIPREWKDDLGLTDAIGRAQKMVIINEQALYKLTFRSRKPEADAFTDWVAGEVLPSIRKQGYYLSESVKKRIGSHIDGLQEKVQKELKHKDELMDMVFEAFRKMHDD